MKRLKKFIKSVDNKNKKWYCNYIKWISQIKAMTKTVENDCFQRVGGCCEPITNVRNDLWLLSRRFESISIWSVSRLLPWLLRKSIGLVGAWEVAYFYICNLSGTADIFRLKGFLWGGFFVLAEKTSFISYRRWICLQNSSMIMK